MQPLPKGCQSQRNPRDLAHPWPFGNSEAPLYWEEGEGCTEHWTQAWLEVERNWLCIPDMRVASVSVMVSMSHPLLAGLTVILRFLRDTGRNWSGGIYGDTTENALLDLLPSWGYLDSLEAYYSSNQLFPQMQLLHLLWWLCCYSFLVLFIFILEKTKVILTLKNIFKIESVLCVPINFFASADSISIIDLILIM